MIYLISDTELVTARCSTGAKARELKADLPTLRFASFEEYVAMEVRLSEVEPELNLTEAEYDRWQRRMYQLSQPPRSTMAGKV